MQHHIAPDNQIERFGIAEGFNRHLAEQHVAEPLPCGPRLATRAAPAALISNARLLEAVNTWNKYYNWSSSSSPHWQPVD